MDRTEFLQMAQKVSVLKNGICGIKENVPNELIVVHDDIQYYPVAYQLSFDNKGNVRHTAIVHDLKVNCITYADLKRVIKYEP